WTGGQPFLTQKLCQLAINSRKTNDILLPPGSEVDWVKNLVKEKIIHNWEALDEPEHLKTIRDRLLRNEQKANVLLGLSAEIFRHGFVAMDDSPEQRYLLLSNLVVKKSGQLVLRNPIYQRIYNLNWIETQLDKLRPFGKEVKLWLASQGQDKSRLLRGMSLKEAQIWANNHSINQEEYRFITASQELEQEELRQKLELERLKAIETKLVHEQKLAKTQKFLLSTIGSALAITIFLGVVLLNKYCEAIISEIKALSSFSQSLYFSNNRFEALLKAIEATQKDRHSMTHYRREETTLLAESALRQAIYGVLEYNRLSAHIGSVFGVNISPNGRLIATGGEDRILRIWQADGTLIHALKGHKARVWDVEFSPNGEYIATASRDRTIKIWNANGTLVRTLKGHKDAVLGLTFSPDGKYIATASRDRTIKIWNLEGQLISSIQAHEKQINDLAYSPDGKILATVSANRHLKFWQILAQGKISSQPPQVINTPDNLRTVAFSPRGKMVAVGGDDKAIRLFQLDRQNTVKRENITILKGHQDVISDLTFSDDGQTITSVSWDQTIKIWHTDGTLLKTIVDNSQRIWGVAIDSQNGTIATASERHGVKLWRAKNPLLTKFRDYDAAVIDVAYHPHKDLILGACDDKTIKLIDNQAKLVQTWQNKTNVLGVSYSPDGNIFVSGHNDGTVKLWQIYPRKLTQIKKVQTLSGHTASVWRIAFNPNGQMFATASEDNTVKLWNSQGKLLSTLTGHTDGVKTVSFSADGNLLASGSLDGTVKIWNTQGHLLATLRGHQSAVAGVDFAPEAENTKNGITYTLASASWDNYAKLWHINQDSDNQTTSAIEKDSFDHDDSLRGVSFSPDGKLIATASSDRSIKLWKNNGELLKTLFGHEGAVWQVKFSFQGNKIVSGSEDKTVIVWDLERINQLDLLSYGCNWVRHYLKTHPDSQQSKICNYQ
ncbi:MAG: WD40 repeat domain-containing protein, partial [Pleurocapsa sp.]